MTAPTQSALAFRLRGLFKQAQESGEPRQITLKSGLRIRVHEEFQKFFVWRTEGDWGPGEASEREGHTCAKALGWGNYRLRWKGPYLIVEDGGGLL